MKRIVTSANRRAQSGATLAVALILLVVVTLLALVAIRGVLLEERMASAQRDRSLEFQAAEAGLRAAEAVIQSDTGGSLGRDCTRANATGCGLPDDAGVVADCANCWVVASGAARSDISGGTPQYLIQRFDSLTSAAAYGLGDSAGQSAYGGDATSFTARGYYRVFSRSRAPGGDRAFVLLSANYSIPMNTGN